MNNSALYKLLSLTAIVAVIAIFYVFSPTGVTESLVVFSSVGLFAFAVGNFLYSPFSISQNRTNTSRMGSIGIVTFFNFIGLALSGYVVYKTFENYLIVENVLNIAKLAGVAIDPNAKGYLTLPCILNIATAAFFLMQYLITKSSTNLLDEIDDTSNFRSAHLQWGDMVSTISASTNSPEVSRKLLDLSEEFKYLTRDPDLSNTEINQSIDEAISALSLAVDGGNLEIISRQIEILKSLLASRERELKELRTKV